MPYSIRETFLENHSGVQRSLNGNKEVALLSSSFLFLPFLLLSLKILIHSLPSFPFSFLRQTGGPAEPEPRRRPADEKALRLSRFFCNTREPKGSSILGEVTDCYRTLFLLQPQEQSWGDLATGLGLHSARTCLLLWGRHVTKFSPVKHIQRGGG